uniref:NADH dehydrogenase subunit 3 n=1 Tax=Hermatobates djiboutensis TaxID=301294 RepID=UPI002E77F73D|nr:NADH dehydrogenase subunit 3 [Hermatobates djiboutensis]WPW46690.1 NADH dehydrogenase subunit 3 [Hermatobates djiboutensis]
MLKMGISMTMAMMISIILMMVCSTISKKEANSREKMSPFECGFDPKSSARMPFSMQFFLIAVIFLIFDIEIVIILPMTIIIQKTSIMMMMIISSMFIITLLLGLYHEWKNGMLEWSK